MSSPPHRTPHQGLVYYPEAAPPSAPTSGAVLGVPLQYGDAPQSHSPEEEMRFMGSANSLPPEGAYNVQQQEQQVLHAGSAYPPVDTPAPNANHGGGGSPGHTRNIVTSAVVAAATCHLSLSLPIRLAHAALCPGIENGCPMCARTSAKGERRERRREERQQRLSDRESSKLERRSARRNRDV